MKVEFSGTAENRFLRLDKPIQKLIQKYIIELTGLHNPRTRGKALSGNLSGLWRYRVGNYRLICSIEDTRLIIEILRNVYRRKIYRDK